jgi:spore maturation protein SpmA
MLNVLWVLMFVAGFVATVWQTVSLGNAEVVNTVVNAVVAAAKDGFDFSLKLTGLMCLFLGLLKIAERAGLVELIARAISPLFHRLMPEVPAGHPAFSSVTMNLVANMLGLDNAATPLGIKAMKDLQSLNPKPDTATNAQILFLVLNASSLTLIPVGIIAARAALDPSTATSVFVPILIATTGSTVAGLLSVAYVQRINLLQGVILLYLAAGMGVVGGLVIHFLRLPLDQLKLQSDLMGQWAVLMLVVGLACSGIWRKVPAYEAFVEGAKEGFETAVRIIPFLVGMWVAIAMIRHSGVLDGVVYGIKYLVAGAGIMDTRWVDAMPTALIKPFSGSGARGMMTDAMVAFGPNSFQGMLVCIIQGSTETTFYILAVYFGSVGVRITRHAVPCGLIAEAAGVISAIIVTYWFFGGSPSLPAPVPGIEN